MHICYVANSRFPSERAHMTQMVHMCNAFAEIGHTVTLLVTDRKTDITQDPETFFGVPIQFGIVRVTVPDIAGRSSRIPGFLRPYLFLIQRLAFVRGARQLIKERGCTHLYGRDEGILFLLAKSLHLPVVWESHEAKFSFTSRALLAQVHRVIVISEGILNFYISRRVPQEKMLVAHDAVDDRFFAPFVSKEDAQRKLGYTSLKPLVLYIGELDVWKGVDTFLKSARVSDPYATGVIGGKPEEIEILTQEYPDVYFFGRRPYRDLKEYLQAGDILVIPNTAKNALSNEYTSPLKLFAYMTAQKPIIASRIPSIQHIVGDDDVFFFDPDDPVDLRNVILKVLQSRELGIEKARRAFEKSRMYTWNERARQISAFIENKTIS